MTVNPVMCDEKKHDVHSTTRLRAGSGHVKLSNPSCGGGGGVSVEHVGRYRGMHFVNRFALKCVYVCA